MVILKDVIKVQITSVLVNHQKDFCGVETNNSIEQNKKREEKVGNHERIFLRCLVNDFAIAAE